jgi:signal transduction histidine kinase
MVSLKLLKDSQNFVQITIENKVTHSMSEAQLTDIFKPLYQIDSSRTESSHFGLGLAIVDKLCAINGYTIKATQADVASIQLTLTLNKSLKS